MDQPLIDDTTAGATRPVHKTHEASSAPVLSGVHAGRRHAGRRKIVRGGRLVGREGRHDVARLGVGQKGQGSADTNFLSGLVLG